MHNPRGSNNRLNEANTNRANNNRLFDTQNNAKGGYCYGPALSYYEGSQLTVEWTAQHGCGNPKQLCVIVLQYMCSLYNNPLDDPMNQIRDGGSTNGLPQDATAIQTAQENAVDGMGFKYGMHENYYYYRWCKTRARNSGLYTADRNVANNQGAAATRQNNNGGQSGYECPEERDYYPYWHPAPWKDVAVLTDDLNLCDLFQKESQNVKAKGYCYDPAKDEGILYQWAAPNNPIDCAAAKLTWAEIPSWGIKKPDCLKNEFVRDNHLGNGVNGFNTHYNWTMPTAKTESCIKNDNCNCVLRIRYNISTTDFSGYYVPFADSKNNGAAAPLLQDPDLPAITDECGPAEAGSGTVCNVTLAIDTSQFARTFQDRSYVFHIKPRPKGVTGGSRIFNLNVKGKRGNIVQTYPSTEYDFHPNDLQVRVGDYIHFQWTGCDTNPAGNAGEGTDQTDRSNMVQIQNLDASVPAPVSFVNKNPLFQDAGLRNRMAFLDQTDCKDYDALQNGNADQDVNNCMNLNKAEQYFDGGLIKMNKTGTFYYMSTRNNNFTNRGQKGSISVSAVLPSWGIALVSVGAGVFVLSMGAGAAMIYAKANPHSSIALTLAKM